MKIIYRCFGKEFCSGTRDILQWVGHLPCSWLTWVSGRLPAFNMGHQVLSGVFLNVEPGIISKHYWACPPTNQKIKKSTKQKEWFKDITSLQFFGRRGRLFIYFSDSDQGALLSLILNSQLVLHIILSSFPL